MLQISRKKSGYELFLVENELFVSSKGEKKGEDFPAVRLMTEVGETGWKKLRSGGSIDSSCEHESWCTDAEYVENLFSIIQCKKVKRSTCQTSLNFEVC